MRKLIEKTMVQADAHHAFIYFKDGTKQPIEMKTVFAYLDKYGILHASKWEDIASASGNSKYVAIDESAISCDGGYPVINGHKVKIYGAGKGWVYPTAESKDKDHKYIVKDGTFKVTEGNSISVLHTDKINKADAKIANEIYLMLI